MTTAERKQRTRRKEDGLGMVQGQTPQGSAAGNSAAETLKTEAEGSVARAGFLLCSPATSAHSWFSPQP